MSTLPDTSVSEVHSTTKKLRNILNELLKEDQSIEELRTVLKQYDAMLKALDTADLISSESKAGLNFDNGKAIGSASAARCIKDWMRTKIFIRGVWKAINDIRAKRSGPVHILYAGTGPYATLMLPIMASLKKEDLQCTLLEVDTIGMNGLEKLIAKLGFNDFVSDFVLADATKYVIPAESSIDILLSETMQEGLRTEMQVPIVLNLIPQLDHDVVLIPEQIEVKAALMKSAVFQNRKPETPYTDYCLPLHSLLKLNLDTIRGLVAMQRAHLGGWKFPEVRLHLSIGLQNEFKTLALLTHIIVYKDEELLLDDCDLTRALMVEEMRESDIPSDRIAKFCYKIDQSPGFEFHWENC